MLRDFVATLYPLILWMLFLEIFLAFLKLYSMLPHRVCCPPCEVLRPTHLSLSLSWLCLLLSEEIILGASHCAAISI